MRFGCVMDPIESLSPKKDTTFDWLLAAQALGHEIFFINPSDLVAEGNRAFCWASPLQVARPTAAQPQHARLGERFYTSLAHFDVCWMRRDPPFDTDYLYSTYILELADEAGDCWVLNKPSGLRDANEKAYALHFPEAIPETLVTHRKSRVKQFVRDMGGRCIVKPLDGHGGAEIFLLQEEDLNINSILEVITRNETRFVMAQRYLPEARQGDKRVLLIDGEPIGGILRVPASGELRGNIHVGGTVVKAELTPRDLELAEMVAPRLRADGLHFVGLDIIGDFVTEINVTSPTGIQEMSRLDGQPYSERWITWIVDNCPA